MYSRQQASQIRQEFWTTFGRYMQPILSSEGEKINWVNYKTGIKHISFKMEAGKVASVAIVLTHPDLEQQQRCFQQMEQLKTVFQNTMHEQWEWEALVADDSGKTVSRIYKELGGVNIFNRADWPALISFFKPRLIAFDEFWRLAKPAFEAW